MGNKTYTGATHCPWCATETLERDFYRKDHEDPNRKTGGRPSWEFKPPEYICRLCGRGFMISASLRTEQANLLFKQHRQMRPSEEP